MKRPVRTLVGCLAAAILVGSCVGEPTGPGARVGTLAVAPRFASLFADALVDVAAVRLTLSRPEVTVPVIDTVVVFPAGVDSIAVTLTFPLEGESLGFVLRIAMTDARGDTVFRAGPMPVRVSTTPLAVRIARPELIYVGTGANATGVRFVNPPFTLNFGQTAPLVAEAFNGQGVIPGTPIGFALVNAADTVRATIADAAIGSIVARSARGSVQVRAALLTGPSVTHTIVIQPTATNVVAQSGGGQTGPAGQPLAQPFVARVRAADGLGVQGIPVNFEVLTGGGSLSRLVDTTDVTGDARAVLTVGTVPGAQSVRAVVPSLAGATASFAATAVAGAATTLVYGVAPSNVASGAIMAPAVTVRARDQFGNDVTSFVGSVTLALLNNPLGAVLGGTLTRTAVAGVATFNDLVLSGLGTGITMRATSGALTAATSAGFNVTLGPAAVLAFSTQPAATNAGSPFAVAVTARDAGGNTVPSFTSAIDLAIGVNPSAGTLAGVTTVNAVAGVATFTGLSINNIGAGYTLVATSVGLTSATSVPFNVGTPAGVNAWINLTGGNWSTPGNWSLGTVPTATDIVWIRQAGTYTVNLDVSATVGRVLVGGTTGTQTLAIGSSTLTLTDSVLVSANGAVVVSGGGIAGTGAMSVASAFTWSGGSLSGAGARVRVLAGGTLAISGTATRTLNNFALEVAGIGTWTGTQAINSGSGGTIRVLGGGTLNIQGDPSFLFNLGGAVSVLDVQGTLTRTTSAGTAVVPGLAVSGSATVSSGVLELQGAGTSSGALTAATGGTLRFSSGSQTLTAASNVLGAGVVDVSGSSTVTSAGSWGVTGITRLSGGTFAYNGVGTTAVLDLAGGTRAGAGALDVTGSMSWTSGDLSGGGGLTRTAPGSSLAISGTATRALNAQTLEIAGAATWLGTQAINSGSGGTIRVLGGGTLNIQGDPTWLFNQGGPPSVFEVLGTLTRTTSTGTAVVPGLAVSGSATVSSGVLELRGAGTSSGVLTAATGATLRFSSGSQTLTAASSVLGAGIVDVSGSSTVTSAGSWGVTGTTRLSGGTFAYNGVGTTAVLDVAGGTRAGSGALDVTGSMSWTSGDLSGGGGLTRTAPGSSLAIGGTATRALNAQTLEIAGAATWLGTQTINSGSGGTLLVAATGALDIQGDPSLLFNQGGATTILANLGSLTRTVSAGAVIVTARLNNSGPVTLGTGALDLRGSGTLGGSFAVAAPAVLRFNTGTYAMQPGLAVTGAGSASLEGATLSGLAAPDTATFSNLSLQTGELNPGVGGVVRVNGLLAWSGAASLGGGGTTRVAPTGSVTMTGTATRQLNAHTLVNEGTAAWSGTFVLNSGSAARIRNSVGATFTWSGDGSYLFNQGGAQTVFENLGTFLRTGAGVAQLGAQLIDTLGTTFDIQAGELRLGNGGRIGGTKTLSGGTLELGVGTLSMRLGMLWSGVGGFVRVTGGTLTLDSAATVTLPRLDLAGGLLTHEGLLDVVTTMNWSGGDITSNIVGLGGTTRVRAGGLMTISGTAARTFNGTHLLQMLGNTNLTGSGTINSGSGAVITNSGLFDLQGSGSILFSLGGASPTFRNLGGATLRSSGATTGTIGFPVENLGALSVTGDSLRLGGGSSTAFAGSATVTTNALHLSGGTFTLTGALTTTGAAGNLAVGGVLGLNSNTVTVGGNFATLGAGTITSSTAASNLNVTGNVAFGGGNTAPTDGFLRVGGSFVQSGATNSFNPTFGHRTLLTGTGTQNITFANPTTSRFGVLEILPLTRNVVLQTDAVVSGGLDMLGGAGASTLIGAGTTQRLSVGGVIQLTASTASPRLAPPVLEIISIPSIGAIGVAGRGMTPDTAVYLGANIPALPVGIGIRYNHVRLSTGTTMSLVTDTIAGDLHVSTSQAAFGGTATFRIAGKLRVTGTGIFGMLATDANVAVVDSAIFAGGETGIGWLSAGTLTAFGAFVQPGGDPAAFSATLTHRVHLLGGGLQQVRFANPGASTATSRFANLQIGNSSATGIQFLSPVFVGNQLLSQPGRPAISRIFGTAADSLSINGILADSITFDGVPLRIGGTAALTNMSVFTFQNMNPAVNQFTITRAGGTFSPNAVTFLTPPNAGVYNLVVTSTVVAGPFTATFFNSLPTATVMVGPPRRYLRQGAPQAVIVWNGVTLP